MAPVPWKTTFLGLLGTPKHLLCGLCCPSIAYYSATEAIDPDNPAGVCMSLCGGYLCCYGYSVRSKLRNAYGLDGSDCGDWCCHLLCHCVALAQVWREAEAWRDAGSNQPPPAGYVNNPTTRRDPVIPYDPRMPDHRGLQTQAPAQQRFEPRPAPNLVLGSSSAGPSGVVGILESEVSTSATNLSGGTGRTDEGDDRVIPAVGTQELLNKYNSISEAQKKEAGRPLDPAVKMMIVGTTDVKDVMERPVQKLDPAARLNKLKKRCSQPDSSGGIVGPKQSVRTLDDMPLKSEEIDAHAQALAAADVEGNLGTRYATDARQPFDFARAGTNQMLRDSVNEALDEVLAQRQRNSCAPPLEPGKIAKGQRSTSDAPLEPGKIAKGSATADIQATFSDPCLSRQKPQT